MVEHKCCCFPFQHGLEWFNMLTYGFCWLEIVTIMYVCMVKNNLSWALLSFYNSISHWLITWHLYFGITIKINCLNYLDSCHCSYSILLSYLWTLPNSDWDMKSSQNSQNLKCMRVNQLLWRNTIAISWLIPQFYKCPLRNKLHRLPNRSSLFHSKR